MAQTLRACALPRISPHKMRPWVVREMSIMGAILMVGATGVWGQSGALAEGALAVGTTGNVSQDGIAYGGAFNYPTRESAEEEAVRSCRRQQSPRAASECEVVATFKRECYAVANDPRKGTPGTGWAIAINKNTAEERALSACQASAGRDRERYCVVDLSHCDERD